MGGAKIEIADVYRLLVVFDEVHERVPVFVETIGFFENVTGETQRIRNCVRCLGLAHLYFPWLNLPELQGEAIVVCGGKNPDMREQNRRATVPVLFAQVPVVLYPPCLSILGLMHGCLSVVSPCPLKMTESEVGQMSKVVILQREIRIEVRFGENHHNTSLGLCPIIPGGGPPTL